MASLIGRMAAATMLIGGETEVPVNAGYLNPVSNGVGAPGMNITGAIRTIIGAQFPDWFESVDDGTDDVNDDFGEDPFTFRRTFTDATITGSAEGAFTLQISRDDGMTWDSAMAYVRRIEESDSGAALSAIRAGDIPGLFKLDNLNGPVLLRAYITTAFSTPIDVWAVAVGR
jgi:hypothetical protein